MENDFKNEIENQLKSHFRFYPEVNGTHFSGKTLKIDHIITPIETCMWKNPKVAFGIEYKDLERIDSDTKNFTKWVAQSVDYANTDWDNFGYIYILVCPGIRASNFIKQVDSDFMLTRIMGHLGVGELRNEDKYGWTLMLQDRHRVWSQKNGVESGKIWNIERKFGRR